MRNIALDTNAYAAFKIGTPDAVDTIRKADSIGVPVVVLGEILSGFHFGKKASENRRELDEFLDGARVRVLDLDEETAEFYAAVYQGLRAKGKPVPTNDIWVAASALRHGLTLLTYDANFGHIDSLLLASTAGR